MSAHQTTLGGDRATRPCRVRRSLNGLALILWEIGEEDDVDGTEAQLAEAHRRAVDAGVLDAGEP